jgi:hypothetical protein
MARLFLTVVGLLYLVLAVWCTAQPHSTAAAVGFTLQQGAGESEFVTVYGGLELALAILFLRPLCWPASTTAALRICLIIHGCLVLFRTMAFLRFSNIPSLTWGLAAGEWIVMLLALACWLTENKGPSATPD